MAHCSSSRAPLKLLVKDVAAAKNAFGPYVQPLSLDPNSAALAPKALRGTRCLVVLGPAGKLLGAARQAKVEHVVVVSAEGGWVGRRAGAAWSSGLAWEGMCAFLERPGGGGCALTLGCQLRAWHPGVQLRRSCMGHQAGKPT